MFNIYMSTIKRVRKYNGSANVGEKTKIGKRCYKVVKAAKAIPCTMKSLEKKEQFKITKLNKRINILVSENFKYIHETEKLYDEKEKTKSRKDKQELQNKIDKINIHKKKINEELDNIRDKLKKLHNTISSRKSIRSMKK